MYLANTRLDIAFVVQQLSQFLDTPHEGHLTSANRVLRYLKGKPALGVFYPADKDTKIEAYADSAVESLIHYPMFD